MPVHKTYLYLVARLVVMSQSLPLAADDDDGDGGGEIAYFSVG